MKHTKTPNNPHDLWAAFQKTGRIGAYLAYREALKRESEQRNRLR